MKHLLLSTSLFLLLFFACGNNAGQSNEVVSATSAPAETADKNYLTMKINGVEWKADHGVFGAFHPKGYNKVTMISGNKGPKDATEQFFNINIYNTDGPGTFSFKDGNPDLRVAQMGGWNAENYICGSMMGHDMRVKITAASTKPDVVEATFEGELTCNSGEVLKITEGKFYYHE
ncbi:MAG: hypothetical protein K9J37_22175 [Saprospiraceae bacterium]|nr:hypothetical protein [Saprospiraceae bacterium]MCF8252630.1 hypothetical protein [Saprospiraceae bacterium]MCF8314199.1 hypothetical protein [Saprospiraceae bacterium]MCF8442999.1 hypothetical protein [Saprospiraceae bacterium]